jgi:mono/diheme cytochrome c family protein
MRGHFRAFIFGSFLFAAPIVAYLGAASPQPASPKSTSLLGKARERRRSPSDLEIGGDLPGLTPGTTRFLRREDLLALPQASYTVTDDTNFRGPTEVSGVSLEILLRDLVGPSNAELVIAICADQYRANYPHAYLATHHPLLVLNINGRPPEHWPKDAEGRGQDMGPYLISHPKFIPSFRVLSHSDEPQIPWAVVRLEFRDESSVFATIAPVGVNAAEPTVRAGYQIAKQNCLRCHNMGSVGGQKARRPWLVLSAWAQTSPEYFAAYVRNSRAVNPHAQMPANLSYDEATIRALTAYFRTFAQPEKP